ncbi:MAG: esterase/lipase family protein [Polyangiales bacterium]
MHARDVALLVLAVPIAYLAIVLVAVSAGMVFAAWVRAREAHAMDAEQSRAFGDLHLPLGWRLRGLMVETWCQALAWVLGALHRLKLLPAPEGRPEHTPVVVLPGYTENSGTMWWLGRRLAGAGFNPILVEFPSTFSLIEDNAQFLAARIAEIRAQHGGKPVAVVAHSMGGLITRKVIHSQDDHGVSVLAAFASPFRGTRIADLATVLPLGRSVRQMRPSAAFVERFPPSLAPPLPVLSVVARQETIVSPEWSVVIAGAEVRVLDQGYGHVAPLFVASVFVELERFLLRHGVTRHEP